MIYRLQTVYAPPGAVDKENHILRGVSAIQAVEALGHKFLIDGKALQQVADLGNGRPNGIKSRFTHPGLSSSGLGKLLGRAKSFRKAGDKTLADLHLSPVAAKSPNGDLRTYVEELAENEPDMFGMSIVFEGYKVWVLDSGEEVGVRDSPERPSNATTKLPVMRVTNLRAVDAVDEPAANRDGMFGDTTNGLAAELFDSLDAWLPDHGFGPQDLPDLINTYFDDPLSLPQPWQELGRYALAEQEIDRPRALEFAYQYMNSRQHRRMISAAVTAKTNPNGGTQMDPEESTPIVEEAAPEAAPMTVPADPNSEAAAAEQNFSAWQSAMHTQFTQAILQQSGLPEVTQQRLMRGRYDTPDQLTAAIEDARAELAALAEADVVQLPGGPPRQRVAAGDMVTGLDQLENAMNWVFGDDEATLPPPSLRETRAIYRLATGDVHWYGRFDGRSGYALAAANPSTLADLVVNAMNKVLIPLWDTLAAYRWYEQIVVVQPNDGSLHDMAWIQFGGIGNLDVVADGSPYEEADVADTKESDAFVKHGNYVGITRKVLRNSDIARMRAIPRALATAAVRTRSNNIATIFTSNSGVGPTLDQDSTALFHVNHGNVASTAYSWNAWKAARIECYTQTELGSGKRQGLWPLFWLGPADLYDNALIDFGYGAGPGGRPDTGNNDVNPFAQSRPGDPRPIPIAVPEFTDTNDWAYLADPMLAPVIQMSYSQDPGGRAHPAPELFVAVDELAGLMFTNDTLPVKVRDEYAYGVATYRGIGKRNVT